MELQARGPMRLGGHPWPRWVLRTQGPGGRVVRSRLPLRPEGSTVEHTIEDRRAQVRLLLGTLRYPSLPSLFRQS
jgi:hypothetical protein